MGPIVDHPSAILAKFHFQIPVIISLLAAAVLFTNLLSIDSIHHYIELILPF